tara:strand:+ start:4212 stop:4631 length:420 start_codon:yes stop_codon:yes gene_type:complete
MSKWINIPDNPMDHFGFVYKITHESGCYYLGKKQIKRRIRRPPLKGKKRRRIDYVESDWKTYWGSSDNLLEAVKKYGEQEFTREFVSLHESKSELAMAELKLQLEHDVLNDPMSFNGIIHVRLSKKVGDPIEWANNNDT